MKRVIPLLIVSALLVVGCKGGNKSTDKPVPSELQTPLPPAPETAVAPAPVAPAPAPAPVVTPAPAPEKAKVATPKSHKDKEVSAKPKGATSKHTYVVKKGDTLGAIAKAHKTTVAKIVALNHGLKPDRIYVGQKLKMP